MSQATLTDSITLSLPLDTLVQLVSTLSLKDKVHLRQIIDDQLWESEDELSPEEEAMMKQSLADYEAGDYISIEELIAEQTREEECATESVSLSK